MDKRLAKRHKRQVARTQAKAKTSEPDVRTHDEIVAAREASQANAGFGGGGPKVSASSGPARKAGPGAGTALRSGTD
ncbi:MAG TPA: hypothetical protein VFQ91_09010 [Bryobacteraceae bacterium]|nr:hypothetical protein [Bryobacteraceae bacterium]